MPPKRNVNMGGRRNQDGSEEGNNGPTMQQMMDLLQQQQDMMRQQQERHDEQMRVMMAMQQQQPQRALHNRVDVVERFRKMNPKEFTGGTDPMVAEEWVKSLEVIFEHLELDDAERVSCAVFMMVQDARTWWDVARVTLDVPNLTWAHFIEVFNGKYFSSDVKSKKVQEFMELNQTGLSVAEYVRQFEQGCRFVPFISGDADLKKDHFLRGLTPRVKSMVRMSSATTYGDMVGKALMVEEDQKEIVKELQAKRAAPKPSFIPRPTGHMGMRNQFTIPGSSSAKRVKHSEEAPMGGTQEKPVCTKCGRRHLGECLEGTNICFWCKQKGHAANKCPKRQGPGQRVVGRVYTMTQEQAEKEDAAVICGNTSILGLVAYTLVDSGATHSFISRSLLRKLGIKPVLLESIYEVSLPSGEVMESRDMVMNCELLIGDRIVRADLVVLSIRDFDIILGMDCLSKFGATIDCHAKKVIFQPSNERPFEFCADSKVRAVTVISAIKAWKMVKRGCMGYLVNVEDTKKELKVKAKYIEVVRENS